MTHYILLLHEQIEPNPNVNMKYHLYFWGFSYLLYFEQGCLFSWGQFRGFFNKLHNSRVRFCEMTMTWSEWITLTVRLTLLPAHKKIKTFTSQIHLVAIFNITGITLRNKNLPNSRHSRLLASTWINPIVPHALPIVCLTKYTSGDTSCGCCFSLSSSSCLNASY